MYRAKQFLAVHFLRRKSATANATNLRIHHPTPARQRSAFPWEKLWELPHRCTSSGAAENGAPMSMPVISAALVGEGEFASLWANSPFISW